MKSLFERLGVPYELTEDGMYYPVLSLPESEPSRYGKYGRMRLHYLQEHHPLIYEKLLFEGKLTAHLNEIDDTANARMELLTRQMQEQRTQSPRSDGVGGSKKQHPCRSRRNYHDRAGVQLKSKTLC